MTKAKPTPPRFTKRRYREVAVAGVLDAVLSGTQAKSSGLLRQLQLRWRQVCPMLGAQSWPVGLTGSTLRVAAQNSSVANELKYMAPTIIDAANLLAGQSLVQKITTVVQSLPAPSRPPVAPPPPAPAATAIAEAGALCKGVADEGLQSALARLGSWIYQEKKR